MDARVRLVLSVTLESKARIRTNVPTPRVPKGPGRRREKTPEPRNPEVLKIIYTGRTCLVDTDLTKMPD